VLSIDRRSIALPVHASYDGGMRIGETASPIAASAQERAPPALLWKRCSRAHVGTINDCKAGKRSLNGLTHWGYNERHRPHSCCAWSRCSLGLLQGSKEVGSARSSKFGVPPRVTYHRGAEQRDAESARRCRLNVARIAPDARAALRRVSSGSSVSIATERPRPVSGMNDMKLSWQRDRPRGAAARCCPDEPTDCH
jgi:hypothetical protein